MEGSDAKTSTPPPDNIGAATDVSESSATGPSVSSSASTPAPKGATPATDDTTGQGSDTPKNTPTRTLSNKELKELKKKEKAAKRAAKKQASGISIEQQQIIAQQKREKKQQQREKQLEEKRKKEEKGKGFTDGRQLKRTTLFSHLETTEQRRATILAVTSAINSPVASRITAAGLMIPVVASTLSTAKVHTPSSLNRVSGGSEDFTSSDFAKSLADLSLNTQGFSVVPGITSIIPNVVQKSLEFLQLIPSAKDLVLNMDLIHPAVILLTYELAKYKIVGSIPRCIAMLEAFQLAIQDYYTPEGISISRNLTNYLSHQIDILKKARPLSVTMGNAIRWLKQEISHIDPSTSDADAKRDLCEKIATFAREKIELADRLIVENASQHVEETATVLTYGSSKVVMETILHNVLELGKNIEVIVVDSRPLFEGRKTAKELRKRGINVIYTMITSLDTVFEMDIDYVFLGAHSILSNGFLYSRAGTAMIAMSAKRRNIPVLVCCESLKFSQRVQLDSVSSNELADPNDLVSITYESPVERLGSESALLKSFIKERRENIKKMESQNDAKGKSNPQKNQKREQALLTPSNENESSNILDDWEDIPLLNIVNILYDLTPPEYIKKVITEFGSLPPSSVPVILREYKGSV